MDHLGVWQQNGNSRIGFGNNISRFAGHFRGLRGFSAGVVKGVGHLVEAVVEQVPVDVHRHRGTGMAEHLLYDLDVGTRSNRQTRGRMAQLMRVQPTDADRLSGHVEPGAEDPGTQRPATPDAGEDQFVGTLSCNVSLQFGDEELRDRHQSALVRLGCTPDKSPALHGRDGLGDHGAATAEVETADAQRGHLAEPHPRVGQEEDHEAVHLVFALVEAAVLARSGRTGTGLSEGFDLGVGEVALLLLDRAREVHP